MCRFAQGSDFDLTELTWLTLDKPFRPRNNSQIWSWIAVKHSQILNQMVDRYREAIKTLDLVRVQEIYHDEVVDKPEALSMFLIS